MNTEEGGGTNERPKVPNASNKRLPIFSGRALPRNGTILANFRSDCHLWSELP
jgi:hypothetical protein